MGSRWRKRTRSPLRHKGTHDFPSDLIAIDGLQGLDIELLYVERRYESGSTVQMNKSLRLSDLARRRLSYGEEVDIQEFVDWLFFNLGIQWYRHDKQSINYFAGGI